MRHVAFQGDQRRRRGSGIRDKVLQELPLDTVRGTEDDHASEQFTQRPPDRPVEQELQRYPSLGRHRGFGADQRGVEGQGLCRTVQAEHEL